MKNQLTKTVPPKISTCDIHRRDNRFYLTRDDDFKYCEKKAIDKNECFKSFKLYEKDIDDNEDYVENNNCQFLKHINYDFKILNDIVNEKDLKKDLKKDEAICWDEETNMFIIRKEDSENEKEDSDEDKNNSQFAYGFNVNMEKLIEDRKYKEEKYKKVSKRKNENLVDMIILKNILNIYFLFDLKNDGYIDLKYATFVIQNIYENNVSFLLENIHLNTTIKEEYRESNESKRRSVRKDANSERIDVKDDIIKNFCSKKFGKFLLIILEHVSVLHKEHGVLVKQDFVDIMFEFIKKNDQTENIYRMLLYPKNILTSFYNYLHYLRAVEDEKKQKKKVLLKKEKDLKNIIHLDKDVVNSDLRYHINHFKKKTDKKMEIIKMEKSLNEMKECTFSPSMTATPHYLLKEKMNRKNKNIEEIYIKKEKEAETKKHIIYDIDNSIERTLMLPNNTVLEKMNSEMNDFQSYEKSFHLKYIVHLGFQKPKKLTWVDTLRNKSVKSIQELLYTKKEKNQSEPVDSEIRNKCKQNTREEKNISSFGNTDLKTNTIKKESTLRDTSVKYEHDLKLPSLRDTSRKKKKKNEMSSYIEIPTEKNKFHKKLNVKACSFIEPLVLDLQKKRN